MPYTLVGGSERRRLAGDRRVRARPAGVIMAAALVTSADPGTAAARPGARPADLQRHRHADGQLNATWTTPVAQSAQLLLYPGNPSTGLADPVDAGAKGGSIASQNSSTTTSLSITTAPTVKTAGTYTVQFFNGSTTFAPPPARCPTPLTPQRPALPVRRHCTCCHDPPVASPSGASGAGCPGQAPTAGPWARSRPQSTAQGHCMRITSRPRPCADLAVPGPLPIGRVIRTADTSADLPASRHPAPGRTANRIRRSVLVCDDRCDVRHELSWALQSDSRDSVQEVPDGDSLLDAYEEGTINQVLIGVHSGTTVGTHAIELLLATHPDAAPIVIGSINDIDLLTGAYARGAGGLLLWEPAAPAANQVHDDCQHTEWASVQPPVCQRTVTLACPPAGAGRRPRDTEISRRPEHLFR